ncbi:putative transcription factor interactor and regulator CCHC(Zn) family [Helianthus anomalus]
MDIQWQMAMISIRARRFMNIKCCKFVGKNVGFDKSKVRCYNCEGLGHFSRECQRQKGESHQTFHFVTHLLMVLET